MINCQLFYDHQNIPSIEISVSQYSHHLNIVEQPPSPSTNTNVTNKKQRIPPWNPRLAKSSHTFYVLPQLELARYAQTLVTLARGGLILFPYFPHI